MDESSEAKFATVFQAIVPDAKGCDAEMWETWQFVSRRDVTEAMLAASASESTGNSLLAALCGQEFQVRALAVRLAASLRALRVWTLVLKNILEHPNDAKYRRLRVGSASFVAMSSVDMVPPEFQSHPDASLVSPAAAANCQRVHVVLCDVFGFDTDTATTADEQRRQQRFIALPPTFPLSELESGLAAVLDRQRLIEAQAAQVQDAIGAIESCRLREAKEAERDAIAASYGQAQANASSRAAWLAPHAEAISQAAVGSAFDHATSWETVRAAVAWLRDGTLSDEKGDWVSVKPLPSLAARAVADLLTALAQHPATPVATVSAVLGVASRVDMEPLLSASSSAGATPSSTTARLRWASRRSAAPRIDGTAVSALLDHVDERAIATLQECDAVRVKLEKERRLALKQQAASALATASATTGGRARALMSEREKEMKAVASNLIGDISALMEQHWRLEGEVGYVAHHRVEAKRLHGLLSEGKVSLEELHSMVDEWTEKVAALKRKLNVPLV